MKKLILPTLMFTLLNASQEDQLQQATINDESLRQTVDVVQCESTANASTDKVRSPIEQWVDETSEFALPRPRVLLKGKFKIVRDENGEICSIIHFSSPVHVDGEIPVFTDSDSE